MNLKRKCGEFLARIRKAKGGFTLVELIVVIAILGILGGVAAPVYTGYIKKANTAADQELLASVNRAFISACMANGESNYNRTDVSATIDGDGNFVYSGPFAETFEGLYEGGEFKVVTPVYNGTYGMFIAGSGAYDGLAGSFSQDDIDAFNESYFKRIGVESLMNQVDMAQEVALSAGEGSTLWQLVFNGGNIAAAAEYVGGEEALLELVEEKKAQLAAINGGDPEDYTEQANKEIIANYAVLIAATKTDFDIAAFKEQLAAGNGKDTIKDSMDGDTGNQTALAQTAMAYALYTSYVTRNGGTATNNIFEVLDTLKTDGFKTYMNTTEATTDLNGYLAAMNMIESASGDKTAGSSLLVNGFTDPELIALLNQEIGG